MKSRDTRGGGVNILLCSNKTGSLIVPIPSSIACLLRPLVTYHVSGVISNR